MDLSLDRRAISNAHGTCLIVLLLRRKFDLEQIAPRSVLQKPSTVPWEPVLLKKVESGEWSYDRG